MESNATAFSSPLANAMQGAVKMPPQLEHVLGTLGQASGWTIFFTVLAVAVVYDQVMYIVRKGTIAGPSWKIPFMGPFLESVNPKFEEYYAKWQTGPLSCVSVFHKFVVIAASRDMARKVFNSPTYARPCVVDVAPKLLGHDNWVFLEGKAHVEFRKGLAGLFTRRALNAYLPGQEEVWRRYIDQFVAITKANGGKAVPFMIKFRETVTALSCRTFCGHYMPDETVRRIADDYYLITKALELVNFPIILPYTKAWYGKKTADLVLAEFAKCSAQSKIRMAGGGDVTCIMDAWIKQMLDSKTWAEAEARGVVLDKLEKPSILLREFSNREIAQVLFTFLFASQDATSSALTWLVQTMAQRPDVLDRVRDENLKARGGDIHKALKMEELEELKYSRAVVREMLRYRPPVLMMCYAADRAFPMTESYTAPKGSMLVATTYPALRDPDVYERPDEFDPERYYTGDAEEKGAKNYLVFGSGRHNCIGQHYAQMNLVLFLGMASMTVDWKHHATPLSEEIEVFATIFPQDHCPLTWEVRNQA